MATQSSTSFLGRQPLVDDHLAEEGILLGLSAKRHIFFIHELTSRKRPLRPKELHAQDETGQRVERPSTFMLTAHRREASD